MLYKESAGTVTAVSNAINGLEQLGVKSAAVLEKVDPDKVYSVVRGIEGDVMNENHDLWQWSSELCKKRASDNLLTWQTWQGKPVCVQHKNASPMDHFGQVLECWPNHEERSVYMLLATDKKLNPQLAEGVERGVINKVSMGCAVRYSNCTYCNKEAFTEQDYCEHIRYHKGRVLTVDPSMNYSKVATIGNRVRVGEDCHDSTGMEMSWVVNPAFPSCVSLDILKAASESSQVTPIDAAGQFLILAKALRRSQDPDDVRASILIEKVASKGLVTPDEQGKLIELLHVLGLSAAS